MIIKELPLSTAVENFFDMSEKNGFERREGQIEMAQEITQAIIKKDSLIVEAGVGIGKSIAYLVPTVLQFFRERRQIIIATSTIALQEQLERDIRYVLDLIGVKANIEVAKGMKNYICLRRFRSYMRKNGEYEELYEKAKYGLQNKSEINVHEKVWNSICIRSFGEKCKKCSFRNICEYFKMRERLRNNDEIVICNQNMLVTHLVNQKEAKGIFKPDISTIVIDEAHNLESKFRDKFTISFSYHSICTEIAKATVNLKNELSKVIIELTSLLDGLFKYLKHDIVQQRKESHDIINNYHFRKSREIRLLMLKIRLYMAKIEMRTNHRLHCLQMFRDADKKSHLVWLTNGNGIRINVSKKDIRKEIGKMLFAKDISTILTSATITAGIKGTPKERYSYFMNSLGCADYVKVSVPKISPFDYDNHSLIYVSNMLPYPRKHNRDKYRKAAIPEILKLLKITHGKALILFTAKDDMNYVFKKLANMGLPYKIMIQSNESTQKQRLENFRSNVDSVILGTGTYWEGINVEGESLSQVIIFKLPFPVPEPIMEYKMSMAEYPLMDVAVPEMIIKLKQGAGRLIRSSNDKGIISILDPRVSRKYKTEYRESVLLSLPEKNLTEDISRLERCWKNMKEGNKND